jgi:hypothetical protein
VNPNSIEENNEAGIEMPEIDINLSDIIDKDGLKLDVNLSMVDMV